MPEEVSLLQHNVVWGELHKVTRKGMHLESKLVRQWEWGGYLGEGKWWRNDFTRKLSSHSGLPARVSPRGPSN